MTGLALSGGADSIYLLHHLAPHHPILILHVNHKLRGPESDEDERFVRSLGFPTLVHTAPPSSPTEQSARDARYSWFRQLLSEGTVDRVALGHTRSDQAETVLFHFLRGAGTAGLAGMLPDTGDGFLRPLLHLTRDEIRASLSARGIPWRDDSTNAEPRFARNRLRHQLLPLLARDWNPRIEDSLLRTADWARAEETYWAAEIDRLAPEYFHPSPTGLLVRWPAALPLAAQRRLIRRAIELAKGDLRNIEFTHVERVLALRAGRAALPGLLAERSFEWLRLGPLLPNPPAFRLPAPVPGTAGPVRLQLAPAESVYNASGHRMDWSRITGSLELRNWHPGDRYRRVGHANEERLKILFQKARIPAWERQSWPVLVCDGRIVWAKVFGVAEHVSPSPNTRVFLTVEAAA